MADADNAPFSQEDIDAVVAASGGSEDAPDASAAEATDSGAAAPDPRVDAAGKPYDETAAAMAEAIDEERSADAASEPAGDAEGAEPVPPPPPDAASFPLPDFADKGVGRDDQKITLLRDVELVVKIELGRSRMLVEDVLRLSQGAVVELDKLAGDPVDVLVNEKLVARGEVLVLNDNFCVRINEIVSPLQEVA
jgi:flagellar motor switch protein FliN/FliY